MPAILKRWIETLAMLLVALQEHRREKHALIAAFENEHIVVREARSRHDITCLNDGPEQRTSADLLGAARNGFVIAKFPPDKVVRRDITVPVAAQKFLSGVIQNQIERLSPWPPNNVVYGFSAGSSAEKASVVNVRILMASRTDIDAFRNQLAELDVQVARIVVDAPAEAADGLAESESVSLWSRSTDALRDHLERVSRLIGISIAATVAMSVCLSLWAFVSASAIRDESESIVARVKSLQGQIQGGRTPSAAASGSPLERAWFLKETSGSSVILLEALSRALPDSAYLTELRLENATLHIVGLADDAPGLLVPLERSGHLTGVHFSAPTTRGSDGKSFRFAIEAHFEPRSKLEKE